MLINPPVVVGVDGSDTSKAAVAWAAQSAALRDAPLQLVSAMAVPVAYAGGIGVPQSFFDAQQEEATRVLEEATKIAIETAGEGKLTVLTERRNGSAIAGMLDWSEHARAIVLGSRGLGEVSGGLLGSVTSSVATHAACPVVVIREAAPVSATAPVVVGVDGTRNSEPAIEAAFEEASFRGAPLTAVHSWSDFPVVNPFGAEDEIPWDQIETAEQAALSESLAGMQERFPDVAVTRVVVKDRPVQALFDAATDAQLVVVGSRGRGGFRGMLLGSTSRALLHSVDVPLMIVRDHR
ncbi:universal stress protein [Rhodococcus sp. D2-41]|uniref:Universal stress protein n=1 Tax=Speluncibacter jeojiensis TaxID=2710754 RepID=A0A9X4M406_9ACTN|nr:universal stress protein [Rhodococcus sp. D2-41]MDG3009454.1 universal stress protein [Rhodococcus sp. D2-41]MDG3016382.1 universal stress protein [Corynebacteriales bacterium D3-21]